MVKKIFIVERILKTLKNHLPGCLAFLITIVLGWKAGIHCWLPPPKKLVVFLPQAGDPDN